jgi:hypothetical protein
MSGLCKGCRWAINQMNDWRFAKCTNPQVNPRIAPKRNPITGEPDGGHSIMCQFARASWGECGPNGKFWEPKQPPEPVGSVDDDPPPRAGGAMA